MTLIFPLCLRRLANCSEWLPVYVTDVWLSCGAQCNATRVWRCNDRSHERLVLLVECSSISTGKLSITKSFRQMGNCTVRQIIQETLMQSTMQAYFGKIAHHFGFKLGRGLGEGVRLKEDITPLIREHTENACTAGYKKDNK